MFVSYFYSLVPLFATKMYPVFVFFGVLAISHGYVNVAINKPTFQQYPVLDDDKFDSSNAVDGRKSDLSEDGGQCAVSAQEQTATLWVNLTSIHSIHHITVYFMTDNDPWGIVTFT
nr:uncharacterized protein LOC117689832 [Crassostrea gigas]